MPRPKPDKDKLISSLTEFVLEHGLAAATLRPMAAAIGTSDRMLIYHFGSKEALMAHILRSIANDLKEKLSTRIAITTIETEADLVENLIHILRTPQISRYMRVWHEIVAAAANGDQVCSGVGEEIIDTFLDWVGQHHPAGRAASPRVLALLEGLIVFDTVRSRATVDAVIDELRSYEIDKAQR